MLKVFSVVRKACQYNTFASRPGIIPNHPDSSLGDYSVTFPIMQHCRGSVLTFQVVQHVSQHLKDGHIQGVAERFVVQVKAWV